MQKEKPADKAKKAYSTPKLITHGDVRKLTGNGHGKGHGDSGHGGPGSGIFSPGGRSKNGGDD